MVRECRLREKTNSALGALFVRDFAALAETADCPATFAVNLVQKIGQGHVVNWVEKGLRISRFYT